jgi:hypothetical protein
VPKAVINSINQTLCVSGLHSWFVFSRSQLKILAHRLITELIHGSLQSLQVYAIRVPQITPWLLFSHNSIRILPPDSNTEWYMAYVLMSGLFFWAHPQSEIVWTWVQFSWVVDLSLSRCETKIRICRQVNALIANFTINVQIDTPPKCTSWQMQHIDLSIN